MYNVLCTIEVVRYILDKMLHIMCCTMPGSVRIFPGNQQGQDFIQVQEHGMLRSIANGTAGQQTAPIEH